jgi:hypothetical protein
MSKFAELPDGTKLEFPDETQDSVIDSVVKKHLGVSVETPKVGSSVEGAFTRGAVQSAVPSLTGLAGGAAAISAASPLIGGATAINPILGGATALGVGIAGGITGAKGGEWVQDKLTGLIPDSVKEATGMTSKQLQADAEQHPYAQFAGQLAPNLALFRPGALEPMIDKAGKVVMGTMAQRAAMGGVGGAVEAGQELYHDGKIDPIKVAAAAAFQGIAATPTKLGQKVMDSVTPASKRGTAPEDQTKPLTQEEEWRRGIDVMNSTEKSILMQLAGEKNADKIQELKTQLAEVQQNRTLFETALHGKPPEQPTQNTPETAVETPPVREEPPVDTNVVPEQPTPVVEPPVRDFAAERAAIEQEYNTLRSKGNAISQEEFARMKDLERQHEDVAYAEMEHALRDWGSEESIQRVEQRREQESKQYEDPLGIERGTTELMPQTPEEVNIRFQSKLDSYNRLPDHLLDAQIERKINLLKSDKVSEETRIFAAEELATLKQIKADRITAKLNKNLDATAINEHPNTQTKVVVEGMKDSLTNGGIRGGLEFLAGQKNNRALNNWGRYLGNLAEHLLNNPKIGLNKLFWNEHHQHIASYDNMSGSIYMRPQEATPGYFLHEVVHSAVNRALDLFSRGLLKDVSSKNAANNLVKLHKELATTQRSFLEKALGKADADAFLSNEREFAAYGLTDNRVQNALKSIRVGGTSFFSKFKEKVANLLGLHGEPRTALDALLEHGGRLIELSDGTAPMRNLGADPVTASKNKVWEAIKKGSGDIFNHGFTYQMRQLWKDDAHVQTAIKFCDDANRRKESLDIELLGGKYSEGEYAGKGKYAYTLSAAEKSDALVPSMHKLKNHEIAAVYDVLTEGYRKGADRQATIDAHKASWSEAQLNFATALDKISTRLYEESVRMQANMGFKNKIKDRMGWILTGRTGDHQVHISYRGVPTRTESFLTKAEADHWADKYRGQLKDFEVVSKPRDAGSGDNIVEYLADTLAGKNRGENESMVEFMQRQLENMTEQNSAIGGHTKKSNALSGFTGDQGGLSAARRGELLRDALPRAVKQYTQNIASREVQKSMIDTYVNAETSGKPIAKRSQEVADFFVRTQIDRVAPEGSLVRQGISDFSTAVRERVSTVVDSIHGYTGRDKHALDRFTGLFSNAFYTANITMKPTIWLAQPLQALMSSRSAFKNGAGVKDVLGAVGETVKMLAGGKMAADKDFIDALYHVSQDGNTLHPQMTNEFNDWRVGGHDPNNMLNKIVTHGTGKSISAAGDKFSRFASFTFFYNLHKRSGLKGKDLYNKAAMDTTENMIAYGNKNLPAIYRETGIVGEQAAPLRTFAHGQAGNLIVDIKEFVASPGARTAAPLMMTGAVIMALGGAISMPLLAEYEMLRLAGIKSGWWGSEWPSVTKLMLNNAPSWVSHGILSSATGMDVDASMRYTSFVSQLNDVQNQGLAVFFPHLSWGKQFLGGAGTLISDKLGVKHTQAEMEQAVKDTIPKGPLMGLVKSARDDGSKYTMMGSKGGAGVEKGFEEKLAPYVGTRSLAEAKVSQKILDDKRENDARTKAVMRASQLWTAGHKEKALEVMMKYDKEPSAAAKAIINQIKLENTPAILRGKFNQSGGMSYEQAVKWRNSGMSDFMENQ